MKKYLITIALVSVGFMVNAKPYSIIDNRHTADGCDYYDITVWDDNGTPDDRSDDVEMGSGTINDCDGVHVDEPTEGAMALVIDFYEVKDGCFGYVIKIVDNQGNELLTDSMASDNCYDVLVN